MCAGTFRTSSSAFISYGRSPSYFGSCAQFGSDGPVSHDRTARINESSRRLTARATQYHAAGLKRERVNEVASCSRIWPITSKKRGSRERSSPPCQIRTLILPRCPEARGNIDLDLNTDSKVLRTLGPRWRKPCGSRRRIIKRFSSRRL